MAEKTFAGNGTGVHHYRGCGLSYRLAGSGPPVLFIQGVAVHGDGWVPQIRDLRSRYRCLSFDNRGLSKSQPLAGKLSVEGMAEDALALMESVGWASAHVVGHSLGGVIAQHLALTEPERVRSLSLICTVSRGADATRMSGRMLWLGIRSSVGPVRLRRRAFLEMVMAPETLARTDRDVLALELGPLFGHDIGRRPAIAMKQLAALRAYDCTPRLAQLSSTPTLVVSAEHDPIAPPVRGRALAAAIPGSTFVEIPGASHGVTIQLAEHVNSLLAGHFSHAEELWTDADPEPPPPTP